MDHDRNLVAGLDRSLFPGRLYDGTRNPEGLSSNIPAVGTTLLGVLTGHWLRSGREKATVCFSYRSHWRARRCCWARLEPFVPDQQASVDEFVCAVQVAD
jgi:hypothetical protein